MGKESFRGEFGRRGDFSGSTTGGRRITGTTDRGGGFSGTIGPATGLLSPFVIVFLWVASISTIFLFVFVVWIYSIVLYGFYFAAEWISETTGFAPMAAPLLGGIAVTSVFAWAALRIGKKRVMATALPGLMILPIVIASGLSLGPKKPTRLLTPEEQVVIDGIVNQWILTAVIVAAIGAVTMLRISRRQRSLA